MSSVKAAFGSNAQAITCTINSLANTGQRQSTVVDNSTNLYLDALVSLTFETADAATAATGQVNVYAYGTADGGTTYSDGATGSDGAITLTVPPNMRLIGVVNAVANATDYWGGPFSVAAAFGGILPDHWGIVVENLTGGTIANETAAAWYQGVYATVA